MLGQAILSDTRLSHGYYLDNLILFLISAGIRTEGLTLVCKDLVAFKETPIKSKSKGLRRFGLDVASFCDLMLFYQNGAVVLIELKQYQDVDESVPKAEKQLAASSQFVQDHLGIQKVETRIILYDKEHGSYRYHDGEAYQESERLPKTAPKNYESLHGLFVDRLISNFEALGMNPGKLRMLWKDVLRYNPGISVVDNNLEGALAKVRREQACDLVMVDKGGGLRAVELKGRWSYAKETTAERSLEGAAHFLTKTLGMPVVQRQAAFYNSLRDSYRVVELTPRPELEQLVKVA